MGRRGEGRGGGGVKQEENHKKILFINRVEGQPTRKPGTYYFPLNSLSQLNTHMAIIKLSEHCMAGGSMW